MSDCSPQIAPKRTRLLYGQVGWFDALENFVHVESGSPMQVVEVRAVAHETAGLHILRRPKLPASRNSISERSSVSGSPHARGAE
jgi:hypothetical protein